MIKLSKRLIFTFIGIFILTGLFSEEEGKYAQGTIFFRVYNDFSYMQVNQNNVVETDQAWFNAIANEYEIYEMIHLFEYTTKSELQHYYSCMFPDSLDIDVVKNVFKSKTSYVEYTFKDIALEFHAIPEEEYYDYQWPLDIIQAEDAWDIDVSPTEEIIVAVIDTGVNLMESLDPEMIPGIHPDLTNNILKDINGNPIGYNVFSPYLPYDDIGHGTHVAGVVAATTNNNLGVASLAGWHENIKIMPVKIQKRLDGNYLIEVFGSRAAYGICWAAGYNQYGIGADIINMSWGPPYALDLQEEDDAAYYNMINIAIDIAQEAGCLCVASAGNFGSDWTELDTAPASLDGVISVAASNMEDTKATYSSYAEWATVTAPGGDGIFTVANAHSPEGYLSTVPIHDDYLSYMAGKYQMGGWEPGGTSEPHYDFIQGTSMSAPMVSSMLALMKAKFPTLTNDQLIEKLYAACDNLQGCTPYNTGKLGAGRMNAYKSLSDGPFENFTIHDMTFDGSKYIPANSTDADVEIWLKNWSHSDISVTSIQGLLTCDPIYGISITQNNAFWNGIDQYEFEQNLGVIKITDDTGLLRQVVFELELTIETANHGTLFETIPIFVEVRINIKDPEIFSELTIDDLDNDGIDEIAFGAATSTNQGKVYLYKNGVLSYSDTERPVTAKIAFADLNNDGLKEIIAVDAEYLYVYDNEGIELYNDFVNDLPTISVAVEDITNDGQFEIVINNSEGVVVYYNCANLPNLLRFDYSVDGDVLSELAIANVDTDPRKDVIFLIHHPNDHRLELVKFNFTLYPNVSGSYVSTEIGNPPNPNNFHSYDVTNILLLKRENDHNPNHSIFFGRVLNETGGIAPDPTLSNYYTYGYEWPSETGIATEIWSVMGQDIYIGHDATLPAGKIIAGEFLNGSDYTTGLELITYTDELIINIEGEGDTQSMGNHIHGHVYEYYVLNQVFYPRNKHSIITNSSDFNNGRIYTFKGNKMKVYDSFKNYLPDYTITAGFSSNEIVSIAFGNAINEVDREVYYLTNTGMLGSSYITSNQNLLCEFSQFQENARNTASYYQPLPIVIEDNIILKHDSVIDKNTVVTPGNTLTIEPGIEIRFEKNKSLVFSGESESPYPGGLICIGTEEDSIRIGGLCGNKMRSYWNSIDLNRGRTSEIEYAIFQNANTAIQYYDSDNHSLSNCRMSNNKIGVGFYSSSFEVNTNQISNNQYGVCCDKYASPLFGYPSIPSPYIGHNGIFYNYTGVHINKATPSFEDGFNDICHNFIYNMKYNFDVSGPDIRINAENNWWGSEEEHEIIEYLDPVEKIIYDPWCNSPQSSFLSREDSLSLFQLACIELYECRYTNAINLFEQVIADSISSYEDYLSIAYMYTCYSKLNFLNVFLLYLDEQLISQPNLEFEKCLLHFKSLSYRATGDYDAAIVIYEDIITNNHLSYVDSCYAVIDIGHTYLESSGRAIGRLSHLRPESLQSHQLTTQMLLESIRTGNHLQNQVPPVTKSILYQNYPNPFNPTTTISFSIPDDSKVDVSIYNIKGQKVKTLVNEEMEKGLHKIVWNSTDKSSKSVSSGVYFYKLKVNGKDRAVKKCLLLK